MQKYNHPATAAATLQPLKKSHGVAIERTLLEISAPRKRPGYYKIDKH
jgi:hypothetical protein